MSKKIDVYDVPVGLTNRMRAVVIERATWNDVLSSLHKVIRAGRGKIKAAEILKILDGLKERKLKAELEEHEVWQEARRQLGISPELFLEHRWWWSRQNSQIFRRLGKDGTPERLEEDG